jgi:phospho-N-acetylmuramoyl-pentapeptide-transferase
MNTELIKLILPALTAFIIGISITPFLTHYLYRYKVWKKQGGKLALGGHEATEFNRIKGEGELKTPRMGGIVIWLSVLLTSGLGYLLSFTDFDQLSSLNYVSRSQTWLPIAALCVGAFVGFLNDFYDVTHDGRGLRLSTRLMIITLMATGIGWWFYAKLGVTTVNLPFDHALTLGILIIPFYVLLTLALYASGVIDGIDGLSGGVFATIFSAYAGLAIMQGQLDLAAFCVAVVGGILAFLWFNIPPARFWMTETGSMALTLSLAVVVCMTDALGGGNGIILLPVIGILLVITVLSNVIQIGYRMATGKKFFRIAPLHHHFEAIGWPSYKVTMRYWVIGMMAAMTGILLATIL